jgi:hypothetical protein
VTTLPLTRYRVTYRLRPERIKRTLQFESVGHLTRKQIAALARERYVRDGGRSDDVVVLAVETV